MRGSGTCGAGPWGHLRELKWSLILFHLSWKFNRKCVPLSFELVRRLTGAIGAEEDQTVLAGALHSTSYVQGHSLVLLFATNRVGFHSPASLVPQLPIVLAKRASRREVKVQGEAFPRADTHPVRGITVFAPSAHTA